MPNKYTPRELLEIASTRIEQKISQLSFRFMKDTTVRTLRDVTSKYDEFFKVVAESVIASGVWGESRAMPPLFRGLRSQVPGLPWKPLSKDWVKRKSRSGSARDVVNFYRGLTEGEIRRGITRYHAGRPTSLLQYMTGLGQRRGLAEQWLGKPSITYAMQKAGGGRILIRPEASNPNLISEISSKSQKTGRFEFLKEVKGVTMTSTITAFPNLANLAVVSASDPEYAIGAFFRSKASGADQTQWNKIISPRKGSYWRMRPVLTPVIQWYLRRVFPRILKNI